MPNRTGSKSIRDDGVDFPPPPWRLQASFTLAASLIGVAEARRHVPSDLEIIALRKGRTLGAIGIVDYGLGSVFPYNELVVICGLVRAGKRKGGWISHIYVDSTRSQAGGHELFGLPKQLASFTQSSNHGRARLDVEGDEGPLLTATTSPVRWAPPLAGRGSAFGSVHGDRRLLEFKTVARVRPAPIELIIADDAPFAHLGLARPFLTLSGRATVNAGTRIQILSTGRMDGAD
jgi:acetoacetate decarboxylase